MTVVRVIPDVPAVDRSFDYTTELELQVGTIVRVPFSGRSVRAWVLEVDVEPPEGVSLLPISKVLGIGPDAETIDMCRWAAWRWSARLVTMLRIATHDRLVKAVPRVRIRPAASDPGISPLSEIATSLLMQGDGTHVLQVSPTSDPLQVALAAAATGQALVVSPSLVEAERLARGLRTSGAAVAKWPGDWAGAAGGATIVGGRTAVFSPAPELAAIVVVDEHDELLQSESSPTWNARDVAVERARRAGVPCILMSPCPSLEAFTAQTGKGLSGDAESVSPDFLEPRGRLAREPIRKGWAPLVVIDRRGEDTGRTGLFSKELVRLMKDTLARDQAVACVLDRTGRARLLACRSCSNVAKCVACGAAVHLTDDSQLLCQQCGVSRPGVCAECGSTALALLRVGVSRAREELEALLRVPVMSLTGRDGASDAANDARVLIGTRTVLNRRHRAGLVAFLDLDQSLLAPRYRAAEETVALLAAASRVVGGRGNDGLVAVQTHFPEHEAVQAALRADPKLVSREELVRRRLLRFPPFASMAIVGSDAAKEFIDRVGSPEGVTIGQAGDGDWLIRSSEPGRLQDVLADVERPNGRLRLQVDPMRLVR